MTTAFRRLLVVLTVLLAGFTLAACSASTQGTPGAAGTSGIASGPPFINVELTPSSLVVSNKAGMPLKDVYFKIKSDRGSTFYQTRLTRMESTERREIPLAEFKTPGGLPWRGGQPEIFAANAEDFVGEKREMMLPLAQ